MERYRATRSKSFPTGGYLDLEEKIILFLKENPNSTIKEIKHATGVTKWALERRIADLVNNGTIGWSWGKGNRKHCYLMEEA